MRGRKPSAPSQEELRYIAMHTSLTPTNVANLPQRAQSVLYYHLRRADMAERELESFKRHADHLPIEAVADLVLHQVVSVRHSREELAGCYKFIQRQTQSTMRRLEEVSEYLDSVYSNSSAIQQAVRYEQRYEEQLSALQRTLWHYGQRYGLTELWRDATVKVLITAPTIDVAGVLALLRERPEPTG